VTRLDRCTLFQAYAAKHPERGAANYAVQYGRFRGSLDKDKCVVCGATEDLCAHHEDYSLPLDVVWLCRSCHSKLLGTTLEDRFGLEHTDQTDASWQACSVCANDYARRMVESDPAQTTASKDEAWALLAHLCLRDALIIIRRFGLDDSPTLTLEETGALFGLTRERVRQIEAQAINSMRNIKKDRKTSLSQRNPLPLKDDARLLAQRVYHRMRRARRRVADACGVTDAMLGYTAPAVRTARAVMFGPCGTPARQKGES